MLEGTQYTYDAYGRLSKTQYYPAWGPWGGTNEDSFERVTYSYDSGTNGLGRLTGVTLGGGVKDDLYDAHLFTYTYAYNPAGRVTNQTVTVQRATGSAYNNLPPINPPIASFTAGYQWDDEGRMTGVVSPTVTMSSYSSYPNPVVMPTMGYQYDINGLFTRLPLFSPSSTHFSGRTTLATPPPNPLCYYSVLILERIP